MIKFAVLKMIIVMIGYVGCNLNDSTTSSHVFQIYEQDDCTPPKCGELSKYTDSALTNNKQYFNLHYYIKVTKYVTFAIRVIFLLFSLSHVNVTMLND